MWAPEGVSGHWYYLQLGTRSGVSGRQAPQELVAARGVCVNTMPPVQMPDLSVPAALPSQGTEDTLE